MLHIRGGGAVFFSSCECTGGGDCILRTGEGMAEVKASTSRGEDAVESDWTSWLQDPLGETSGSEAERSTYPESVPPSIASGSPSFFKRIWIQILTACSGVWGARGGGLSGPRVLGLASGAQETQEDSESEVLSRIAASESTWSEVPGRDIHHSISVSRSSQLSVWEELKASAPGFFRDEWVEELELGRLIAEGGQAQIFGAKLKGRDEDLVLKVFKLDAGFSLSDLKLHWPLSMRKDRESGCSESRSVQERCSRFVFEFPKLRSNFNRNRCFIRGATLLKDGRFALLMHRFGGDLRTLIDEIVEENNHPLEIDLMSKNRRDEPPFSFRDSIWIMSQIAVGMQGLHEEGVLHRDLKAANILVEIPMVDEINCYVADYECDVCSRNGILEGS